MKLGIGCDIGGTFTDLVMIDERTGTLEIAKVLTTADDPSDAVETGLRALEETSQGTTAQADLFVHGTTLVINSIIERKGARTGLITTRGFRDVLEIGREKRYDGGDLQIRFPEPLVPRPWRQEVDERIHASGRVLRPLDRASVTSAVETLLAEGVESVAICLLNSFANPSHEQQVAEIVRKVAPGLSVTVSHEVLREVKEFERASTTAVNAYTKPKISSYIHKLQGRLEELDFAGEFLMMQSSGGLNTAQMAREFPVQITESGPAAGVVAAAHYAQLLGENLALAFDMGGTTAKMCLVKDGRVARTNEMEVDRVHRFKLGSGLPVRIPMVDLMEIGAGGGSIAKVSGRGTLEVGPESASADPGPACYGRGGTVPTVSDANLVLGYLNPDYFLGARMALDEAAANRAIEEKLAKPLGLTVKDAAWGIHALVNENMASAAKVYVTEKGYSPEDCAIVAFGGAGPLHACDLAARLGAKKVVVLPRAGVASAFGMLISPVSCDTVRTHRTFVSRADFGEIEAIFSELEQQAASAIPGRDRQPELTFERVADMRYVGQGYEISVPVTAEMLKHAAESELRQSFNEMYRHLYGRVFDELELEIMNLRVTATAPSASFRDPGIAAANDDASPAAVRLAYSPLEKTFVEHGLYRRADLAAGTRIVGPAIIEEAESTTIISSRSTLIVDGSGALVVQLAEVAPAESAAGGGLDPIILEMLWRRMSSTVDELAAALVRTSFSTVVRDVKDYACAIFDRRGQLLVQSSDSTPGIAGGLAPMVTHMLDKYPPHTLVSGDVLIGNNPWHGSGHHNDIFLVTPAFHDGQLIGFASCAAHHVDIGGRRATTESRNNYEEGLRIPVLKALEAGLPNETVFDFIAANVRLPETVLGDLRAQLAANHVACERLQHLCASCGWSDLQPIADEIIARSREIAEREIEKIPDGIYRHEAPIAVVGGETISLRVAVEVAGRRLKLDFSGSSPQVGSAINCTLTYTAAYANFAIGALLQLPVGVNHGSLDPIEIFAEPGTVLNATFPAPTFARTSIGNFVPEMIFTALSAAMPTRVIAGSGSTPLWAQYIFGTKKDGTQFAPLNSASGGLGARYGQDGVSCLTFPVNIGNAPAEILEGEVPLVVVRRELWPDSCGPGRFRGGLGQIFEIRVLDGELGPDGPLTTGFRGGRFFHPVPGLLGGGDGPTGRLVVNGELAFEGGDAAVPTGGTVLCQIPGGGGLGDPRERDPEMIRRDIAYGYISEDFASRHYGHAREKTLT